MHIRLNFQLFIIILLIFLTKRVEIYTITLLFILIHEMSHIVASICIGFKIKKIDIMPLGFSMLFEKLNTRREKLDKLIISISGPLTNIIIAILFIFIPIQQHLKEIIVYSNLLLAIINLIPIYPLDGGRILKELLSIKYSSLKTINIVEKVTYISIVVLTILSSILILYYKNIAIFAGVIFLWYLAIIEYRKNKYRKIAYSVIDNGIGKSKL